MELTGPLTVVSPPCTAARGGGGGGRRRRPAARPSARGAATRRHANTHLRHRLELIAGVLARRCRAAQRAATLQRTGLALLLGRLSHRGRGAAAVGAVGAGSQRQAASRCAAGGVGGRGSELDGPSEDRNDVWSGVRTTTRAKLPLLSMSSSWIPFHLNAPHCIVPSAAGGGEGRKAPHSEGAGHCCTG